MRPLSVVIIVIALLVVVVATRSVRVVPIQRNDVVERSGKYHRTLTPGVRVVWPFVDRIRGVVDMREQVVTMPPTPFNTADDEPVTLSLEVYFKVVNPATFAYAGPFLPALVEKLTAIVQATVGEYGTGQALNSQVQIGFAASAPLDDAIAPWATKITRLGIISVQPPPPKDGKGWVYRKVA